MLRASPGRWSEASRFLYRWKRCNARGARCTLIGGLRARRTALGSRTYSLTERDVGHTIRVTVLAVNAWGRASATSRPTAVINQLSSSPHPPGGGSAPGSPPGSAGGSTPPAPPPSSGLDGLRVSGDQLVDDSGNVVHLHGVNRSGTEYACIQGWGIFDNDGGTTAGDTPTDDDAQVPLMAAWHINIVRIPLNEDCWLGINVSGINPAYVGQNYINAIVHEVDELHSYGMYAELSLIWAAPGTAQATYQPNAPDEDHSPTFWTSLASTFKNDPDVILAPWGETTVGWSCFLNGCNDEATYGSDEDGDASCGSGCWYYDSAGMQQAVTDMRDTGYNGPIAIPCIDYANDCSDSSGSWLQYVPSDPDNQLLAEAHVYGKNGCDTDSCFNSTFLPILKAGHPMIWGETGETYDGSDCPSTSYISDFLNWADQNGVGEEVWTWDAWGGCSTLSLITNYASGAPLSPVGTYVQSHYLNTWPANP